MYNDLAFAPFGEQYAAAGTTGVGNVSFAGNNEDTTTNLYDAQFREYGIQGRWPSPDPAGTAAVDPTNPQSWNRYAYVLNNPLLLIDPLGLDSTCTNGQGQSVPCPDPIGTSVTVWGYPPGVNGSGSNSGATGFSNGGGRYAPLIGGDAGGNGPGPQTPTTHWYKNPCVTSALKSGAVSVGVDALGFLPEAGGVARVVGHQAGYVGKVADNLGKNMLTAGTKTTGVLSSATGFSSSDWTTWVSAGITAADFVPVLSDFTTPVAMAWDAGVAAYKVYQCPK